MTNQQSPLAKTPSDSALTRPREFLHFANQAQAKLLERITGDQVEVRQVFEEDFATLRAGLEGPNPTRAESLLAETAVSNYAWMRYFEMLYAVNGDDWTIRQNEFQLQRIAGFQARMQSAIKALYQVRRLQLPSVQVNIGEKQVNIGSLNARG